MPIENYRFPSLTSLLSGKIGTFIKFGLTGMSGLAVDFVLTWFFKDELYINKFIANAIGFSVAVISNYIINRNWTFKDKKSKAGSQFAAFVFVSLTGLLFNSVIIFLLDNIIGLNFYVSKSIAILLVFFWNFSANYFFVFKASKRKSPQ